MDADVLRGVLTADVAVELGLLTAAEASEALAGCWTSGGAGLLDALPAGRREQLEAEVERVLAGYGGDVRAALAHHGVDREIPVALDPETSHALSRAGARFRSPLRQVDGRRYLGFTPLAEGGMGVVYLAVDTELNRRVAFKIIRDPSGGTASPLDSSPEATPADVHARFLQEAWVTGGLEHPGIVPVYELGQTPSGMPYYTMRLIRGERTLADAIAAADGLEQRLALLEPFLKTCDAIRYAHSRGVIHRDLKPANIALGEFGEAVVLDWGLARLTSRPDVARSRWHERLEEFRRESELETMGELLGTPGFMAQEAALGLVDTVDEKSDVYSLGAILYLILTGRPPVVAKNYSELVAGLREPAAPPHELDPAVPAELSRICCRAVAPGKDDRYESVGRLAAGIRTWQTESTLEREIRTLRRQAEQGLAAARELSGEPMLREIDRAAAVATRILDLRSGDAGARALLEQARELRGRAIAEREHAARKRLLKRVAVLGLAAATAATIVVAILLDARRREAEQARRGEASQRQRAVTERSRAEELAAFMLVDLTTGLQEVGRVDLLERVARRTLEHYDDLAGRGFDPHAWHTRMVALDNVGLVDLKSGRLAEARARYEEALSIARRLARHEPTNATWRLDVVLNLRSLADLDARAGDHAAAVRGHERAHAVMEPLAEEHPGDESLKYQLALGLDRLGQAQRAAGDLDTALASCRRAETLFRDLDVGNARWQSRRAANLTRLGKILRERGEPGPALDHHRAANAILERLVALQPGNADLKRELGIGYEGLGDALVSSGDRGAAAEPYQASFGLAEELAARDPANYQWQFELSVACDRLGNVQLDAGDIAAARESYERSLAIRERLAAHDPGNARWRNALSIAFEKVGDAAYDAGDPKTALARFREAERIARPLAGPGRERGLAVTLLKQGQALDRLGRLEEAHETLEEAEAIHARCAAAAPHLQAEHAQWRRALRRVRLLAGHAEAGSASDHLVLAYRAFEERRYAVSAGHFDKALEDARVRADLARGHVYNAACAAARASVALDGERAAAWRTRAMEWLGEDVGRRRALLADIDAKLSGRADPSAGLQRAREALARHLARARDEDPDLAPLRGDPAFAALFDSR